METKNTKKRLFEVMSKVNKDFIINENYLSEAKEITTVEDFFDFLATNPKLGSAAYVYYCAPVKINKNLEGRGKNALKNPMYSEVLDHAIIFKSGWYSFSFGELYANKMKKFDPNWTSNTGRTTVLVKHPEMKYIELGPDGEYFTILPTGFGKSTYAVYDINAGIEGLKNPANYKVTDIQDIKQFFPPQRTDVSPFPTRKLFVSRVYELAAGSFLLKPIEFKYVYFGEKAKSRT
jgi:hypothetical protein